MRMQTIFCWGLLLNALACGSVVAQDKDAAAATWQSPIANWSDLATTSPAATLGGGVTQLVFDPLFGNTDQIGQSTFNLDYSNAAIGEGLRVYPMPGNIGWYVLARHKNASGYWDAVVIKVRPNGLQDTVYLVVTGMRDIKDAVMDPVTGKFYFAGSGRPPAVPGSDREFAVTCVDIQTSPGGSTCQGFGNGGTAYVGFNLGGGNNDYARRMVVRPNIGLLLIGVADLTDQKQAIAVASLYRGSGALYTAFGTGGRFTKVFNTATPHAYLDVADAALSNDADAQTRLYVAGLFSRDDALRNFDGYVLALEAMTGVPDAGFGTDEIGVSIVSPNLGNCSVNCWDGVSAIHVLHDGKLAFGGWSTDINLNQQLILGRLNHNGRYDASFHNGGWFSFKTLYATSGFMAPTAIAERAEWGELVVAMDRREDGNATTPTVQALGWWSANGSALLAGTQSSFPTALGETRWESGVSLLVDGDSVMLAGTRRWNATDYDVTLSRILFRGEDIIFADSFELTQ